MTDHPLNLTSRPVWVYDNWSAYTDSVHDRILDEAFSLEQLRHVERAQSFGVHFDYAMMNAFWFEPTGRYRTWRPKDWPNGPDAYLAECGRLGLKPGMWFGTNTLWKVDSVPEWQPSFSDPAAPNPYGMLGGMLSMSDGPFLEDFVGALHHWYDRGVRMFEFDVAVFDAATPTQWASLAPAEIRERNIAAFVTALGEFRAAHPDAVLVAFNGFGGDQHTTESWAPFEEPVDPRFLTVFETLYVGDVRVSDVPQQNFWRSMDLYHDHMVRAYEANGIALDRTDPTGFTMTTTEFGYHRRAVAWRSMLLHTAARGTWKKTIYGDLGLLTEDDARWFARVQEAYAPLYDSGRTVSFGGVPGRIEPYGFSTATAGAALHLVVNPAQRVATVELPEATGPAGLVFADSGFTPELRDGAVVLGPGQLAVVGRGSLAGLDLGREPDVVIPSSIEPVAAEFVRDAATGALTATVPVPEAGLRIVAVLTAEGRAHRASDLADPIPADIRASWAEWRPDDVLLPYRAVRIEAEQDGAEIPVDRHGPIAGPGGVSWGVGEVAPGAARPGSPLTIRCIPLTPDLGLTVTLYAVAP